MFEPEHFGDNWGDTLSAEDLQIVSKYFQDIRHLASFLDFVNVRVGGEDNVIPLGKKNSSAIS